MSKALKKLIDINRLREFKNKLVGTDSPYVQTGAVDQTVAGTKAFSEPIVGSVTGSSGSCTGNSATATKATQDSDGNKITTTYSKNGHTHDDRYYTENEVNNLLNGKANTSGTYSNLTVGNADSATNATNSNAANQLQAFVNDDFTDGNHYVKAIRSRGWSTHLWMCYNNGAKMADEVSVNYANSAGSANTANSATNATYANYVQTQTSAYHKISFDWYSQVPDYVGLRVDKTDMGGIVTTNRLVSDIRAQWYAAYPDGPEAHNATWGGRDITAAFDSGEFSEHIADGTFRDIFPGDYITKSVTISGKTYTVNWVVADCDYWINKGDTATTAHHVVIVPQVPIFTANMNATNTTEGGYAGSRMYRETIPACATGIVSTFGSGHILTFRDSIVKAVNTSSISSGTPFQTGASSDSGWYDARCNLMCERMVYGMPAFSSSAWDAGIATRQMSAFRLSERLINYNRQLWWLRDVAFSAVFARVSGAGNVGANVASLVSGVRPFALLC